MPGHARERDLRAELARLPGNPAFLTKAEIADWVDVIAGAHLARARRYYALTPEQAKAVERRLAELKPACCEYWRQHQSELREIAVQLAELGPFPPMEEQDASVAKRRETLMKRRSELMIGQPLHIRAVRPEIEKLLPPAQVRASLDRWNAKIAEDVFQTIRDRRTTTNRAGPASQPALIDLDRLAAVSALGEWKEYVHTFVRFYHLDPPQASAAQSILRDLEQRRDAYKTFHQDDYAVARSIEGRQERYDELARLDEPIRMMFDELKGRLDQILTTAQRNAAVSWRRTITTTRAHGSSTEPTSKQARGGDQHTLDTRK